MKTKDLVVGQQYAVRRGQYTRPFRAILLSTDKYVRNGRNDARPANPALGERGGLPFAAAGYNGQWVPLVLQPSAVFAPADDFDKAQEEIRAKEEAEWKARQERAREQAIAAQAEREARVERSARLNEALVARGLPEVIFDDWSQTTRATVDIEFIEQVVRRLKPLTTKTLGRGICGPSVTYKS